MSNTTEKKRARSSSPQSRTLLRIEKRFQKDMEEVEERVEQYRDKLQSAAYELKEEAEQKYYSHIGDRQRLGMGWSTSDSDTSDSEEESD